MRRKISLAALAVVAAGLALLESVSHIGRGWWRGEAFYHGRPASYWARELVRWREAPPAPPAPPAPRPIPIYC